MINGPMKPIARKILGVLTNNKEKLFTDREIVEELRKLGIKNGILVKRTVTVLAKKKRILLYKPGRKRVFYSAVPGQKQLTDYFG